VDKSNSKIIVILGPTACGKSVLAVNLAKKFNGEIISADSRQIYKGLDIGSGKVPNTEVGLPYIYKGVIHHLFDVASPKRTFTVAQYQKLAKKTIKGIIKKGKIPIICGGTAFYIYSLIYNWQLPKVPPQKKLRKKLEKKSSQELFEQLKKLDPKRAKNIDRYNKRRLVRALEIVLVTKTTISSVGTINSTKNSPYRMLKIGIKKDKKELQRLINKRLLKRLKIGMINEVKNLHKKGVNWKRLDELGLEYRYISYYLRGLLTKEQMIKTLNQKIWQFSKRQMTWFKKDEEINWVKSYKEAEKLTRQFLSK